MPATETVLADLTDDQLRTHYHLIPAPAGWTKTMREQRDQGLRDEAKRRGIRL
jgi:hypothetical protein